MQYTNNYNINARIAAWLVMDEYDIVPNTISTTTLLAPPRAWALRLVNKDNIIVDVSNYLSMSMGTAIHNSIERVGKINDFDIIEQRFQATLDGIIITGKMDYIENGKILRDIKTTSVWKFIHQDFDDYIKQMSIYRWILDKNGIKVENFAVIDFIFTDWKKSDSLKGGDYPKIKYQAQTINLMSLEDTEIFIRERLEEFAFAQIVLPECTASDLWMDPDKFAVYKFNKDGSKQARAWRVCDTMEAAQTICDEVKGVVEIRKSKPKRCSYCNVCDFCEQYQDFIKQGLIEDEEN